MTSTYNISYSLSRQQQRPFAFMPDTTESDQLEANEVETNTYDRTHGPIEMSYLHKKIRDTLKKNLIDL